MKKKTPDYTRRAIKTYEQKFDKVCVNLPKGTKDKIKELTGLSINAFINQLVLHELERLENNKQ